MRYTDIAIIGGGLAGSTAAAMLGRAGIATLLIDPHENYPFDFRAQRFTRNPESTGAISVSCVVVSLDLATHGL